VKVELTCECGRAIRTEIGSGERLVPCPACGRVVTLSPGVAVPPPAPPVAPRVAPAGSGSLPAGGKAVAALVFGLCGFIPGLGLLCAPVGIGLGIAVLVRKLRGRGFGIAGIATGAAGLLIVQTMFGMYVFMMVSFMRTVSGMTARAAMSAAPTTMVAPMTPVAAPLTDEDIAAALGVELVTAGDLVGPRRRLADARAAYACRDAQAGSLYECVKCFRVYLAQRGLEKLEDPSDRQMLATAQEELREKVLRAYRRAEGLETSGMWNQAAEAFGQVAEMVPDEGNEIHRSAAARQESCRDLAERLQSDP
jgi:hypothetical protein